MAQMYGEAVRCEALRAEVFDGKKSPMIFGEPEQWLALLIESLLVAGRGERERVAGAAGQRPSTTRRRRRATSMDGRSSGSPTPTRGSARCSKRSSTAATTGCRSPRLTKIELEAPEDLRDVVWMPAHLQFENGGESVALIPTRYPGSEAADDGLIALARKTVWEEIGAGRAPRARPAHPRHRRRRHAAHGRPHDRARRGSRSEPDGARRRAWLSAHCPRSGCSRRCSIGSPTTSRTRSRSRASARVMSKSRLRAGGAARSRLAVQRHAARSRSPTWRARRTCGARWSTSACRRCRDRPPRRSTSPTSSARSARRSSTSSRASCRRRCRCRTLLEAGDLDHHNVIGVEIHGQLWAQPVPLELLVRTEFDLETGQGARSPISPPSRVA